MLLLKDGVILAGNKYTNAILEAVQAVFEPREFVAVITAGRDGKHSAQSYHYKDRAIDLRFWNVPTTEREQVAQAIRDKLPGYYDVVVESDHYHIEADAKKEGAK